MYRYFLTAFIILCSAEAMCQGVINDPTKPPVTKTKGLGHTGQKFRPALQAIIMAESGNKAVINGIVYLEAQQTQGVRVIEINANSVDIEHQQNGIQAFTTLTLTTADVVKKSVVEKN